MVSSVAMIAITASSSIRVKPRPLPVTVRHSVEPDARRARAHVVDVVARLRIVRRARVGPQPPGAGGRRGRVRPERIPRQASQEVDLDALLDAARILDPIDQGLQVGRITALVDLLLDAAGPPGLLVGVDRSPDRAQGGAQLALALALVHQLRRRDDGGGQQRDDRHRDHQLDDGEASVAHRLAHGATAILSGVAWVAATATPSSPTSTTWVAIAIAGRAATTRKRRLIRVPPPETGAPSLPASSSCTPPGLISTFGDSPDGARSPASALTSCSAEASNPTCVRMRPSAEVEASLTETLTSSPILAVSGPSIVTFGLASAAGACGTAVASAAGGGGWGGAAAAPMRGGRGGGPAGTGAARARPTPRPAPERKPPGAAGPPPAAPRAPPAGV